MVAADLPVLEGALPEPVEVVDLLGHTRRAHDSGMRVELPAPACLIPHQVVPDRAVPIPMKWGGPTDQPGGVSGAWTSGFAGRAPGPRTSWRAPCARRRSVFNGPCRDRAWAWPR